MLWDCHCFSCFTVSGAVQTKLLVFSWYFLTWSFLLPFHFFEECVAGAFPVESAGVPTQTESFLVLFWKRISDNFVQQRHGVWCGVCVCVCVCVCVYVCVYVCVCVCVWERERERLFDQWHWLFCHTKYVLSQHFFVHLLFPHLEIRVADSKW